MSREHWEHRLINAVTQAATGKRARLIGLAQMLEDADLARDVLRAHGYGADDDGLLAMVAEVCERKVDD